METFFQRQKVLKNLAIKPKNGGSNSKKYQPGGLKPKNTGNLITPEKHRMSNGVTVFKSGKKSERDLKFDYREDKVAIKMRKLEHTV